MREKNASRVEGRKSYPKKTANARACRETGMERGGRRKQANVGVSHNPRPRSQFGGGSKKTRCQRVRLWEINRRTREEETFRRVNVRKKKRTDGFIRKTEQGTWLLREKIGA